MSWTNQDISRSLKVRIYKALILPIAIYGADSAETWTLRQADTRHLESFEMRCPILGYPRSTPNGPSEK